VEEPEEESAEEVASVFPPEEHALKQKITAERSEKRRILRCFFISKVPLLKYVYRYEVYHIQSVISILAECISGY